MKNQLMLTMNLKLWLFILENLFIAVITWCTSKQNKDGCFSMMKKWQLRTILYLERDTSTFMKENDWFSIYVSYLSLNILLI